MSEEYEWGPWIEHDGKGCPCVGKYVCVINRGFEDEPWFGVAGSEGGMSWDWSTKFCPVIRYRIRKPRALRQLRDMVENLPAPEREVVGAPK